jgi:steroid delta-isomerase-like uncharacterized protein
MKTRVQEDNIMSYIENKAVARNHYVNTRDLNAAFALISPTVVFEAMPGLPPTYEGWKQAHIMFLTAFPDQQLTIEDEIAEADTVVTRWTFTGTHQGPLMGVPATGKRVALKGISVDRVRDGKVIEHRAQMDMVGLMQQLGMMPPPQHT